jgi:acyl carrier protein
VNDELLETIRETLSIKEGEISLRTPISKIIRDSIDMVELVAVLSDRYQIAIEPDELRGIKTVGDIARYVTAHRGEAAGSDRPGRY